jgi:hypothetical protein
MEITRQVRRFRDGTHRAWPYLRSRHSPLSLMVWQSSSASAAPASRRSTSTFWSGGMPPGIVADVCCWACRYIFFSRSRSRCHCISSMLLTVLGFHDCAGGMIDPSVRTSLRLVSLAMSLPRFRVRCWWAAPRVGELPDQRGETRNRGPGLALKLDPGAATIVKSVWRLCVTECTQFSRRCHTPSCWGWLEPNDGVGGFQIAIRLHMAARGATDCAALGAQRWHGGESRGSYAGLVWVTKVVGEGCGAWQVSRRSLSRCAGCWAGSWPRCGGRRG